MRYNRVLPVLMTIASFATAGAQSTPPAVDPSARLRQVLPADVAERVLAKIAEARSRELPAAALENRALKFASRGVTPAEIEKSIYTQASLMQQAKGAIESGRRGNAQGDEVEAGAETMRKGVDGAQVSELAKSAPSGRSLTVPLFVVGSLMDRGLPSDEALKRVHDRLVERASDRELEDLPRQTGRPATTGRDLAATKRPAETGRAPAVTPPTTVPRNAGKGTTPTRPTVPATKRP